MLILKLDIALKVVVPVQLTISHSCGTNISISYPFVLMKV